MGNHVYEVDVFAGENEGLILAEIELGDENESFEKPIWLGKEVTNDERFYNAYLSKNLLKAGDYFGSASSIVTITTPEFLLSDNSINALLVKSISRAFENGPRSVTSTITDFPLASLVTLKIVPKGNFLCAAVNFIVKS